MPRGVLLFEEEALCVDGSLSMHRINFLCQEGNFLRREEVLRADFTPSLPWVPLFGWEALYAEGRFLCRGEAFCADEGPSGPIRDLC